MTRQGLLLCAGIYRILFCFACQHIDAYMTPLLTNLVNLWLFFHASTWTPRTCSKLKRLIITTKCCYDERRKCSSCHFGKRDRFSLITVASLVPCFVREFLIAWIRKGRGRKKKKKRKSRKKAKRKEKRSENRKNDIGIKIGTWHLNPDEVHKLV